MKKFIGKILNRKFLFAALRTTCLVVLSLIFLASFVGAVVIGADRFFPKTCLGASFYYFQERTVPKYKPYIKILNREQVAAVLNRSQLLETCPQLSRAELANQSQYLVARITGPSSSCLSACLEIYLDNAKLYSWETGCEDYFSTFLIIPIGTLVEESNTNLPELSYKWKYFFIK